MSCAVAAEGRGVRFSEGRIVERRSGREETDFLMGIRASL